MSFDPVWSKTSKAIILGTWPSPKSWQQGFYYGHPQNRFWPLLAKLTNSLVPATIEEKKALILQNGLALWDVLESCTITGAQDSSIKNPVPVDLPVLLAKTQIQAVFCNGAKSYELYEKYLQPQTGIKAVKLPSTSPANAAFSMDKLYFCWQKEIAPFLTKK